MGGRLKMEKIDWPTTINILGKPEAFVAVHTNLEEMECTIQHRQASMRRYAMWDSVKLEKEPVLSDYFQPNILVHTPSQRILEQLDIDLRAVRERNVYNVERAMKALTNQLAKFCECVVELVKIQERPDISNPHIIDLFATAPIYYYED